MILGDFQRPEVSLAAVDLGGFAAALVVDEQAALGLGHELDQRMYRRWMFCIDGELPVLVNQIQCTLCVRTKLGVDNVCRGRRLPGRLRLGAPAGRQTHELQLE